MIGTLALAGFSVAVGERKRRQGGPIIIDIRS
jgi:hypothetical protein